MKKADTNEKLIADALMLSTTMTYSQCQKAARIAVETLRKHRRLAS